MKGSRREEIEDLDPGPAGPLDAGGAEGADEPEPDPEYRRRRKPVRVRRNRAADWGRWWRRGRKPLLAGSVALALAAGAYALLFDTAWFVLAGSDQITVSGAHETDPARILGAFSSDLGRNVFFIPLEARRRAIEAIPWVRSARVLRLWPARLQVRIQERVPVAYARVGETLKMLDAGGVVLDRPAGGSYDFPVLTGLAGVDAADANAAAPLAQRQPQMKLYAALRADLDRDGGHHSHDFSEIDLADTADVKARVSLPESRGDPGAAGATVLIHFGDHNFGARYELFLAQIAGWRQKYPALASVDLRYDGEAIVDPGTSAAPAAKASGAKPGSGGGHPTPAHPARGR